MLLNGIHLLPDETGALVWPQARLLAVADPLPDPAQAGRDAPEQAALLVRQLSRLMARRRPSRMIWMGTSLSSMMAADALPRRERTELDKMISQSQWDWLGDGQTIKQGGLTFRLGVAVGGPSLPGEILARPNPLARLGDGRIWPCYACDGRRLFLPAWGSGAKATGHDVMGPAFLGLFRRPFHVLALADGRVVTKTRAALAALPPPSPPPDSQAPS